MTMIAIENPNSKLTPKARMAINTFNVESIIADEVNYRQYIVKMVSGEEYRVNFNDMSGICRIIGGYTLAIVDPAFDSYEKKPVDPLAKCRK